MCNIFAAIVNVIFDHIYPMVSSGIVPIHDIFDLWSHMNKYYISPIFDLWSHMNKYYISPTSHAVEIQIKYFTFTYVTLDHMYGNITFHDVDMLIKLD